MLRMSGGERARRKCWDRSQELVLQTLVALVLNLSCTHRKLERVSGGKLPWSDLCIRMWPQLVWEKNWKRDKTGQRHPVKTIGTDYLLSTYCVPGTALWP